MDKRVTPLKRVTSPTWGPPPPCKQALKRNEVPGFRGIPICFLFVCLFKKTIVTSIELCSRAWAPVKVLDHKRVAFANHNLFTQYK